jgi:GH24 family phage-related lysozyme (muramidase)
MNFHNTTGTYLDDRYTAILQWEESGSPHLTPYNDGSGWVTIGVGF